MNGGWMVCWVGGWVDGFVVWFSWLMVGWMVG